MPKTLLLLRHAKSSREDEALPDHERPLNGRGKRDAPRMGRVLLDERLVPELIVSSTAVRARKTAARVAEACGYERAIELRSELYEAPPSAYLNALRDLQVECERVLMVGHNPGLEELVRHLTGRDERLSTAALVQIALPVEQWSEVGATTRGELIRCWRPKELDL